MNVSKLPTLLFVPGLRDHVEDHWQTIYARKVPGAVTVPPLTADKLSRAARVEALEAALSRISGPVVLVAHSAGVMITVHWAQTYSRPIHGALLAAPADLETPLPEGYPQPAALAEHGWLPIPRQPLPFPSMVAASTNDPLAKYQRAEQYAQSWGSRLVNVGAVGHLNPAAGFGDWATAKTLVQQLCSGIFVDSAT